jgi:hypothetical protein
MRVASGAKLARLKVHRSEQAVVPTRHLTVQRLRGVIRRMEVAPLRRCRHAAHPIARIFEPRESLSANGATKLRGRPGKRLRFRHVVGSAADFACEIQDPHAESTRPSASRCGKPDAAPTKQSRDHRSDVFAAEIIDGPYGSIIDSDTQGERRNRERAAGTIRRQTRCCGESSLATERPQTAQVIDEGSPEIVADSAIL